MDFFTEKNRQSIRQRRRVFVAIGYTSLRLACLDLKIPLHCVVLQLSPVIILVRVYFSSSFLNFQAVSLFLREKIIKHEGRSDL